MGIRFITARRLRAKVGSFRCLDSTGNYSVTGVGFRPRCVDFVASQYAGSGGNIRIKFGQGWMDYNGNQGTTIIASKDDDQYTLNEVTKCIGLITEVGAWVVQAAYVSMDADGFTINFSISARHYHIHWKAEG